jgi:hypothetical protein
MLNELQDLNKVFCEFLAYGKNCIGFIDSLASSIRSEYRTGKIDLRSYERQINLLTVIRLHLEHMDYLARQGISKGAIIDATA